MDGSTMSRHSAGGCAQWLAGTALVMGVMGLAGPAGTGWAGDGALGLGHPPSEEQIRAWDIDVTPFGDGLPPGRGSAKEGTNVYAVKCAACHGQKGIEGPAPRLVGGIGTLATADPVKTVGSYWPYATTVFDYVRRAMPLTSPQSLSADETYAVVAWILAQNGIIPPDRVMDASTLPKVEMPNRKGFVADPRPDVPGR